MKTFVLTLTEDQAEIVGWALIVAARRCDNDIDNAKSDFALNGALGRRARLQTAAHLLDTCPITEGTPACCGE